MGSWYEHPLQSICILQHSPISVWFYPCSYICNCLKMPKKSQLNEYTDLSRESPKAIAIFLRITASIQVNIHPQLLYVHGNVKWRLWKPNPNNVVDSTVYQSAGPKEQYKTNSDGHRETFKWTPSWHRNPWNCLQMKFTDCLLVLKNPKVCTYHQNVDDHQFSVCSFVCLPNSSYTQITGLSVPYHRHHGHCHHSHFCQKLTYLQVLYQNAGLPRIVTHQIRAWEGRQRWSPNLDYPSPVSEWHPPLLLHWFLSHPTTTTQTTEH